MNHRNIRKVIAQAGLTLFLGMLAVAAWGQDAQGKQKKERTIELWGHVRNSLTRANIKDVRMTLMQEDSTVVDSMRVFRQWWDGKEDYAYRFLIPAREQKYIIRAEHPDYETTDVNYHVQHIARNSFFDAPWHYMKKKASPDYPMTGDSLMEGQMREVVVRATKIKMTYNGDTITFNADAFNLPEGSMLDALVRQMDGVELKDDGRIFVHGEQVDELMLNGRDFFKGNNRVMLDNLPAYTVKQVQTYHKSTELDEYLGRNYERKRFVMDVQLKREYNQGWLANVEAAGGSPFRKETDDRYLARLFALRYTNNSRLSAYGTVNNVNENRRPGSDGEWSPSNVPTGVQENRLGGLELMIDEKDKRWTENAQVNVRWTRATNETQTNAEQFHTDAAPTYNRSAYARQNQSLSLSAYNTFQLRKPFFLRSESSATYSTTDNSSVSRSAQFSDDPARYGKTTAILDSVFTASLSTAMQQSLINSNLQRANGDADHLWLQTENTLKYKLASGDDIGLDMQAFHARHHDHGTSEQQLRYQLTPTLNSILNRHSARPSNETSFNIAPSYRIAWLNGLYLNTEYRFLFRQRNNTNDIFLADTLDLQNAYDRTHRRLENRVALTPGYTYNKGGRYIQAYYKLQLYNVNEQLDYRSAYVDTTLVQHKWNVSPMLYVEMAFDNWARSLNFFYDIDFQTPDLFQKVNILNDENPLVRRYGNPDLRGATIHRLQFELKRNWRARRISHRINGGVRIFRHQVSQGQNYDPTTGITTYRPENVEGNWQAYIANFYNMPLDRPRRLMLNIYTHGDYTRNVDMLNGLSHVNNYYIENRLTLSYTWRNLTLGLPTNVEFRHTTNEEHTIETINAWNFQYGLTVNYNFKREDSSNIPRWLQGFTLATDLKMYSRRGYGDRSLNRNDLVWNASVARSFPRPFGRKAGGTLIARLEGFDILGQLSSTNIVINGQGRTETVYNTLPRYLMLHLVYQWAKQPKKK